MPMSSRSELNIPDLAPKRILVTGASAGIGAAVALGFLGQGARVAIHYGANRAGAERVAAGAPDRAVVVHGDLTRGHAKEFVADGIRVNAVAPGVIQTAFHDRYTPADLLSAQVGTIPMGRAGTPEECVGAYLFLASKELSGYLTGQVIEVNGGQLMV